MRSLVRHAAAIALAGAAAALLPGAALAAQGMRITGITTARYVDLLTFAADSVSIDSAEGDGALRTARGVVVRCIPGEVFCRYTRSDRAVGTMPLTQDLEVSGWGFGEGIQLYAQLRGRAAAGSETDIWPQADDHFDALAAWVELERDRFRARVGRQFRTSGLGYYNFDGASVLLRATPTVSVDVFGGRSLVRGTNEYHTNAALNPIDDIPPDEDAWIVGVQGRARLGRVALGALYQRELASDRSGLYSERISVDGTARLLRQASLSGELEADLATRAVNQARLRLTSPLARRLTGSVEYRHYVPFFELWTIWGAFAPIGYDEANAAAMWGNELDRASLRVSGGWRRYAETNAGLASGSLRRDGWRVGGDATLRLAPEWQTFGGVRTEIGFGAARTDGDLGVRWEPSQRGYIAARATAWQSSYELRLGTGTVYGAGFDCGIRLGPDLRLLADVATYRHTYDDGAPARDWNQRRGSLRLEWSVGRDPGMGGGVR